MKVLAGLLIAFVIALIIALPVMLLWNDVMPELFSLKTIGFWKALELSMLCSMLFKASASSKD